MKLLPYFIEDPRPGKGNWEEVSLADRVGLLAHEFREPLSRYLLDCQSLVSTQSMADPLDPARDHGVPTGLSSDGIWVWPTYWGYFVKEYGIEVPVEFIEHAKSRGFQPVLLDEDALDRVDDALEAILSD
ncbi:hypothetical protein ACFVVM_28850 [Nocardia sp. NPDC058176]|uniref:hypothetical protein n=1 Tax=Nocardia sp. NPDC058176 TaxID=3346368 RepID=UPI0036DB8D54